MTRIDDAVSRARLLLHPEEAPLPTDGDIAVLLEQGATRLESATTRAREIDRTIRRLNLAKQAIQAARRKEAELPGKATTVHTLREEVEKLVSDDESSTPATAPAAPATPPAPPAGTTT